jgi:hypothetical protein
VFGWTLVLALIAFAIYRLVLRYRRPRQRFEYLVRGEVAFLESAAEAMFPSGGAIPISGIDAGIPGYVDRYLATLPRGKRRQIRLLFGFFEQATLLFPAPGRLGFRRFSSLDRSQREAVLRAWAESRFFVRQLVFTALRALLTMGYLGHPSALGFLRLAPYQIESPICEADLLYPRIGALAESNPLTRADLTPPSDGTPLDLEGPLHPDYVEKPL